MAKILRKDRMDDVIGELTSTGQAVLAPVANGDGKMSQYAPVLSAGEIDFEMILPVLSIKSLFFPRTETLLKFTLAKQAVDVAAVPPDDSCRVVFGARPCEAASLVIMDKLFNWDCPDAYWNARRENTTVVAVACTRKDDFCMCTSLNLSPDSALGTDVLLRALADETGWLVEVVSEKGQALVDEIADFLIAAEHVELAPPAEVDKKFDVARVNTWLSEDGSFDSDLWGEISRRCLGCGVCTYLCPTCHCFDIQDEGDSAHGVRRKNWDSCSFALFTAHTSGHNPRPTQGARWRQRIFHKFSIYPEKFEYFSCTGCGRCVRHCPVDMGVTETLVTIGT